MERTYKYKQSEIRGAVHEQVAAKQLDLKLDQLGPYRCRFDRSGQCVVGSRSGEAVCGVWCVAQLIDVVGCCTGTCCSVVARVTWRS